MFEENLWKNTRGQKFGEKHPKVRGQTDKSSGTLPLSDFVFFVLKTLKNAKSDSGSVFECLSIVLEILSDVLELLDVPPPYFCSLTSLFFESKLSHKEIEYFWPSIVEIFLATTELFIESGNVYIETKRNVDPYIAFLCIPAWSYGGKIRIISTVVASSSGSSSGSS